VALRAETLAFGPFNGGVRYDVPVEEVSADELSNMENTRVGIAGQVEGRRGLASYKDVTVATSGATVTLLAEFESAPGTSHVVRVVGTAVEEYSSGAWNTITGSTTVTAGNVFEWADANGTLVFTNGVDTDAIKWSGAGNATTLDDNARFSKGKHIAWFDNRLWIGNVNGATNQLWYSDTADIETWGATSFFNFGGVVTGLSVSQNALTVHTSDGIYTLIATGSADTPYRPNKRTAKASIGGRCIEALPDDTQLMVLEDGVYQWSGGSVLNKVSYALDEGYWPDLNVDALKDSFSLRFPRENEVWFFLPNGVSQTDMNQIMVYNYRKATEINGERVGVWYGPYTGNTLSVAAPVDEKPHAGDLDTNVWDMDSTAYSDNGVSIPMSFETGAPSPYGPDVKVRWLNARHYYDALGDYTLSVTQKGADIRGEFRTMSMAGSGLILPGDIPALIADLSQRSQDLPLVGFAPQTSLSLSVNGVGETISHRRILARFKPLGRFLKPKPVDE